jgi:hypothetical protein
MGLRLAEIFEELCTSGGLAICPAGNKLLAAAKQGKALVMKSDWIPCW